ncbi:MAG: AmmeMemoRadiSam system protein B [Candidatus Doudnabacteria bacterium]
MSNSTRTGIVFILGVLLLSLGFFAATRQSGKIAGITTAPIGSSPVAAVGFEYGDLIKQAMAQYKALANLPNAQISITSHHLPTAVSLIAQLYNTLKQSQSPHQTFVVVGPDHYEHCKKAASTTKRPYYTPYGILDSNTAIIDDLIKNGGVSEIDGCFDGEHSIGVHSMFIKLLYPDSTIVPIIYSSAAPDSEVEKVAQVLAKYKDEITVVISVDFSHYQATDVANQLDADSGNMIKNMDGGGLTLRHMDSPASIKTAIALAKLWNLKPRMLKHANSYDFTGQSENTTGYWDIVFTK